MIFPENEPLAYLAPDPLPRIPPMSPAQARVIRVYFDNLGRDVPNDTVMRMARISTCKSLRVVVSQIRRHLPPGYTITSRYGSESYGLRVAEWVKR